MKCETIRGYQELKAANDASIFTEQQTLVIARATELTTFIATDARTKDAVIRLAQVKLGIVGGAANWTEQQVEAINNYIELAAYVAVDTDMRCSTQHYNYTSEGVIRSMKFAMEKIAREMPSAKGR